MIYSRLDKSVVDPILDYPALKQSIVLKRSNPFRELWKGHFTSPLEEITIRHILSDKPFFRSCFEKYIPKMESYVSRHLSKIIAVVKLNSLPPPPPPLNQEDTMSSNNHYSNSSTQNNDETSQDNANEAMANQSNADSNNEASEDDGESSADSEYNGELTISVIDCSAKEKVKNDDSSSSDTWYDDDELKMRSFFKILNDPAYLPFLLNVKHICITEITMEIYSTFFPHNYNLPIESHPSSVDRDFVWETPLLFLYHMYPSAFEKYADAYGVSQIGDLVALSDSPPFYTDLFIKEFDEHAPLVILPYRRFYPHSGVTNIVLQFDEGDCNGSIRMKILDGELSIEGNHDLGYTIICISPEGKWDYIDIPEEPANPGVLLPHKERVEPGTIYAVSFKFRFNTYRLVSLLWSLNTNIEHIADALEDFNFSLFSIAQSNRNSRKILI